MVRQCPRCRTDEHHNRSLQLMVSECGHPLCKQCVDKVFGKSSIAKCPQDGCEKSLKRNAFRAQIFDDPRIEKENIIRKRVNKVGIYLLVE